MATFQYQAQRADRTPVEGFVDANDLESARLTLQERGLLVLSIQQVKVTPPLAPTGPLDVEQALQKQMNRVLDTWKPLAPALQAYAQELPRSRRRLCLERIVQHLDQPKDQSHNRATGQIDLEWISILFAGGLSDPNQILSGITDESQRESDIRGEFVSVLAYPLLMFIASSAILLFISVWIVPIFGEIFKDLGMQLSVPTHVVLGISQAILDFWPAVVVPVLLLAAIIFYSSGFRGWAILRVPLLNATVRLSDRTKFIRFLADLVDADVPISDALRISARNSSQAELRQEAEQLATRIDSRDQEICDLPYCGSLPHTVIHAIQLQSNPKAAALILREVSWIYAQQLRIRLAWVSKLAEPVMICSLGSVVGFYVFALFSPLLSLIQSIT